MQYKKYFNCPPKSVPAGTYPTTTYARIQLSSWFYACGGMMGKGASSSSKPYFKDVVRNKSSTPSTSIPPMPSAYIVEKIEEVPLVEIQLWRSQNTFNI
jgi:hypothetical protein